MAVQVYRNHNRYIRLALARDPHSRMVSYLAFDDEILEVKQENARQFDLEWQPLEYDVKEAARKMLASKRFTTITQAARQALNNIIDGKEIAAMSEAASTTTEAGKEKDTKKAATKKATTKKAAAKKAPAAKGKAAGKTAAAKKGGGKANGEKKPRGPGIGSAVEELIMAGKLDNEAIVAAVLKKFPDSKLKPATISWYRQKLKKEGKKVPAAQ